MCRTLIGGDMKRVTIGVFVAFASVTIFGGVEGKAHFV